MLTSRHATTGTDGDVSSSTAPGVARDNTPVTAWQHALPLPWRVSPPQELTAFAHPAEREFARILTFHRVRWVYEPTTFVLERDAEGRPTVCFNPDFYLPDHHRYLELTTMRQAHVTRKNRKLRLLRERYPTIDAHILYRRDVERLAERCRVRSQPDGPAAGAVRLAGDEIADRIREIAEGCVGREAPGMVISLGRGAERLAGELASELRRRGVDLELGKMTLTGADHGSEVRRLRVHRGPPLPLERRRLLLVTDVVSTGLTADFAIRWLAARGAGPIQVVTLVDRPGARIVQIPIRAAVVEIGDIIVAGHGMSLCGRLGDLDDIVVATLGAS